MHPFYGALPKTYVLVRDTRGPMIAHRYTNLCTSSKQNLAVPQDFYSLSESPLNDLGDLVLDDVGLARFISRTNTFLLP